MGAELLVVLHILCVELANGNSTDTTAAPSSSVSNLSKAFISLSVLGAACIISYLVAKIVDYCYDRAALRDDASDISEHTRQLIRARLALSRFKTPLKEKKKKKKKSEKETKKNAKVFLNLWSKNAKKLGSRRLKSDIIINVEEAKGEELNGSVKRPNPHVTFIDEVQHEHGAAMSIAVPKIKTSSATAETKKESQTPPLTSRAPTKNKDNVEIATISAKVAEKENSGKTSAKDNSGKSVQPKDSPKVTLVRQLSGRTSPSKDTAGKVSASVSGRTTPNRETAGKRSASVSGWTTPSNNTKSTASSGRATPTPTTTTTPSRSVSRSGKNSPVSRSSSPSKTVSVTLSSTPSRPKTAPSPKPGSRVVSVKATIAKSPSSPKLSVKTPKGSTSKSS